jgi:hypothetical protein
MPSCLISEIKGLHGAESVRTQELPSMLWKPIVQYRVHKSSETNERISSNFDIWVYSKHIWVNLVLFRIHLLTPGAEPFLKSRQFCSCLRTSQHSMEPEGSPPCLVWSSGQSSFLQIQRSRVRFSPLPDFLSSSGPGTGSIQPLKDNWGATWNEK